MGASHHGRPYRRLCAQVRAQRQPCWLCGHDIDLTLPATHPMSFTLEHVVPVARGGDPLDPANARSAHRRCNSIKGDRPAQPHAPTSRAW